jgi:hypothetical protein
MSFMDKVWDVLINKGHVLLAAICQGAVIYLDRTGHQIGLTTQQTINWFYLFLAGHFGASQIWPDKNSGGDSNANANANASTNTSTDTSTVNVVVAPAAPAAPATGSAQPKG